MDNWSPIIRRAEIEHLVNLELDIKCIMLEGENSVLISKRNHTPKRHLRGILTDKT